MNIYFVKQSFKRKFTIWLASYLAGAILLLFYFHAPFLPIVLAGFLTFGITFIKRSQ